MSSPEHFQAKHVKHAIYFEDNGIQKYCVPCFCLNTRQQKRCHWHCPKCQHILCRAPDFIKHLHNHDLSVIGKITNKPDKGPSSEKSQAGQQVREQPPIFCIDERNGIFVTPKDAHGPRVPLHVKKHMVSGSVACESSVCRDFMRIGVESGNPGLECIHLQRTNRAVCYSAPASLREDSLQSMVDNGLLSKTRLDECVQLRNRSIAGGVDCVFPIIWHEQTSVSFFYFSVFTGVKDSWCQFKRTRVSFDSHLGKWHCQCRNKIRSCVHRYLCMWWLFQEKPHILSCQTETHAEDSDVDERVRDVAETEVATLASTDIQELTDYLWRQKRVPENLPQDLSTKERQIPDFFEPLESNCPYCPGPTPPALGERVLITRHGTVYGISSVTRDVPVYVKNCLVCKRPVRFQEYQSGFHNYDNRTFLTIPLCSLLTSGLANHIALGRFLQTMEDHANITFPHNLIRKAFYHFSALREYSYNYSCVRCGHSSPVLVADGNWKIAFDLPAHLFRRPNLDNISQEDTQVNVSTRWETLEKEMTAAGFCDGNKCANPYSRPLTYTAFTPWLGNCSRISDIVPKTEVYKVLSQKDRAFTSSCGLEIDEEAIMQVLESKTPKKEALVKACNALGVSHVGSTTDLINRLEELLLYKDLYPKMFVKLQKAGGGVLHMSCPHSVVYYQSALWWQESARDHGDALLSFKHPPTVYVSDIAGRVARHVNNRTIQRFFQPYDGRLCENTTAHIQAAVEKRLEVRFPWVTSVGFSSRKVSENEATYSSDTLSSLHPVTGTNARFSLYDRFHQKNQKRQEEVLRSLKLAPHVAALVNSSVAEQLNRELSSSRYSLCQMRDEHYMFSLRLYFHLHNKRVNEKYMKTLGEQAKHSIRIGLHGKLTFRSEGSCFISQSSPRPDTDCWGRTNIRARKETPDFQLQNQPNPLFDHVLDGTQSPDEIIGAVGKTVLKRSDLMSLGLNQEVEATVMNCCLSQLSHIAGEKGKDVHVLDSYVVATWQQPLNCDPFLSLPTDAASKDCILFPICKSAHWTLCVSC
ncbi:uncharacterized protein [Paramisgurnus dabryanus]|uniref:uncharacterized protein isoform X3 n=1 Tax=Paramisgurnus dabryanus TaxID=90735 RepID=UPI003CCF1230